LHREGTQAGDPAELLKAHGAIDVCLNVSANLIQGSAPCKGSGGTAALAWTKTSGLRFFDSREETDIFAQR
jgi:hypothetical protein